VKSSPGGVESELSDTASIAVGPVRFQDIVNHYRKSMQVIKRTPKDKTILKISFRCTQHQNIKMPFARLLKQSLQSSKTIITMFSSSSSTLTTTTNTMNNFFPKHHRFSYSTVPEKQQSNSNSNSDTESSEPVGTELPLAFMKDQPNPVTLPRADYPAYVFDYKVGLPTLGMLEAKEYAGGEELDGGGVGWDTMSMEEKDRYIKLLNRRMIKEQNMERTT